MVAELSVFLAEWSGSFEIDSGMGQFVVSWNNMGISTYQKISFVFQDIWRIRKRNKFQ